jgi:hypothetical protein
MSAVEKELQDRLSKLDPHAKRQLLEYARTLETGRPRGTPGSELLRFVGRIPKKDLQRMREVIEEDCERIDPDGW